MLFHRRVGFGSETGVSAAPQALHGMAPGFGGELINFP